MRRIPTAVLGSAVALLAVAGCGEAAEKITEEAIEQSAGGEGDVDLDFDEDGGSVKVETEDGTIEYDVDGSGGELADDFPSSVPVVDGFKVVTNASQTIDGEKSFTASGTVDGDPEQIYADIVDEFESAGWETTNDYEQTSNGSFTGGATFSDGEYDVNVGVLTDGEGETFVSYTVTPSATE